MRGYIDRVKFVVNLGCKYGPYLLDSSLILRREGLCGKWGYRYLASNFIRIHENEKSGATSK